MKQDIIPLLEINEFSVSFKMYNDIFKQSDLEVISCLNLTVYPGEILAVAGSSGSGKSLLASAILGILPSNATVHGNLFFDGKPLTEQVLCSLRGSEIALVPQSVSFLDPNMKVGKQADGHKKSSMTSKRKALFKKLNLPNETENLYPFQLSGGMARRVLVSTALLSDSRLIIADEPTPGMSLDQAKEALSMFREIADEGKGVVLITHDIDLAYEVADRIAVLYAGTIVEVASSNDFKRGPDALRHPYSKALWRALPQNEFEPMPGFQPYAGDILNGCLFGPRCPYKTCECEVATPPMRKLRDGEVRCLHAT